MRNYVRKTKNCKICGKRKNISIDYYRSQDSYCKDCLKEKQKSPKQRIKAKLWREKNKAKTSEYYKNWYNTYGRKRNKTQTLGVMQEIIEEVIKERDTSSGTCGV